MDNQRRSGEHERHVQELRRSDAAGAHGESGYVRKGKYPSDWLEEAYNDGLFDEEEQ